MVATITKPTGALLSPAYFRVGQFYKGDFSAYDFCIYVGDVSASCINFINLINLEK